MYLLRAKLTILYVNFARFQLSVAVCSCIFARHMKRIILIYIWLCLLGQGAALAQINPNNPYGDTVDEFGNVVDRFGNQVDPAMRPQLNDTSNVEIESLPPTLYMWQLDERFGNVNRMPADTAHHNFHNVNLTEGVTGHYNYLANLGAPRLSHVFFERSNKAETLFMEPYSFFFLPPQDFKFTNSNVPYTNLTYYKAGNSVNGEERFQAYFSVNVNKQLAFGFNLDYVYGRGYYNHQSTSLFNGSPFISYMSDRYEASLLYNYNYLKNNENGGITDDRYIIDPEGMANGQAAYGSVNIPTVMNASTNYNSDRYVFLNHRYKLGFYRELPKEEGDTLPPLEEFVPVTSFIHTMKLEWAKHKFTSEDNLEDYYANTYFLPDADYVNDSTSYFSVKNLLGIALLEGFNKYAKAGLTAFISHKFSRYKLMNMDLSTDVMTENEVYAGMEIAKREGNLLHYRAIGELGLLGTAIGQFRVNGDADLNFRLWKDTVTVTARAYVKNELPSFYMRHYHSRHFYWDNSFTKEFRTRVEGELSIPRWGTVLKAGVENLKNYTYFNSQALPEQFGGNIQVLSASLCQNFKLGIFHLDNEIIWQKSSNGVVLPLPELSLYHNLYLQTKLFKKVLSVQLGADVRYFTQYHAPAYMPAIGQFYLQPEDELVQIGNYPLVNVYLNFQLKRTRIFAMMYHVNEGLGRRNYFYAPHYPINPRLLKFGVSWNFYD